MTKEFESMARLIAERSDRAFVFENIALGSGKPGGERADFIVLHPSGLYLLLTQEWNGIVSGNEAAEHWVIRTADGTVAYMDDPAGKCRRQAELLSKKCKGISNYLKMVIVHGNESHIAEMNTWEDLQVLSLAEFLEQVSVWDELPVTVPGPARDSLKKQLTMLQIFSK